MNQDMLRIIDGICRDRSIEKDKVFEDLEQAIVSAVRKMVGQLEEVTCTIDRSTGAISASLNDEPFDMATLGRIAAQTAKQVMIQKIREAERGSIYEEYIERKGEIVTGTISRIEGGALVVSLGRAEGFLPRSEQIPGESHTPGERIRSMVLDVREAPHQVKIVLSRTHPDLIRRLFALEVPEVGEKIIEIKAMAREAGYRTKVAVSSIDTRVDAVGACVGVRGSRIKSIVDELGGEKIDIVRWNESSQILIGNSLKPAEVQETALCFELNRATVVVAEDQLSLAIGKRGQNVRLAARLTGWDIDILTPAEYNKGLDDMEKALRTIEGVDDLFFSKLMAMGIVSLMDIEEVGIEPLEKDIELTPEQTEQIVTVASEQAKRIAEEMRAAKEAAEEEKILAEAAAAAGETVVAEGEAPAAEGETAVAEGEATVAEGEAADVSGEGDELPAASDEPLAETEATGDIETPAAVDAEPADAEVPDETPVEESPSELDTDAGTPTTVDEATSEETSDAEAEPVDAIPSAQDELPASDEDEVALDESETASEDEADEGASERDEPEQGNVATSAEQEETTNP